MKVLCRFIESIQYLLVLLDDTIDDLEAICKEGQRVTIAFEGEHMLYADRNILRNILVNLLSNALKYSGENQPVEVNVNVSDGKVLLSVTDHGIGIPESEQHHMFERFFRANNSVNIQGTGLGLNIVKKYLDLMGGDIWFESKVGIGTTFHIVLPQKHNS